MYIPLTSAGIIIAVASPAAPAASFFSSQLFGIIIGGAISAVVSFAGSWIIHKQQQQRDKEANKRQLERDRLAYEAQLARERDAYLRSLKDAKRERLRNSYKILLKAADTYQFQTQQLNPASGVEKTFLAEVDEVVTEITLEDIGDDVLKIFFDLRGAANDYAVKSSMHIGTGEEILKHRDTAIEKFEELKTAMKRHLKELEQ